MPDQSQHSTSVLINGLSQTFFTTLAKKMHIQNLTRNYIVPSRLISRKETCPLELLRARTPFIFRVMDIDLGDD